MIAAMPETIRLAAQDPLGAVTLSYALLLDDDEGARRAQLRALAQSAAPPIVAETMRMHEHVRRLDRRLRLPALDVAVPALRNLGPERAEPFLADVTRLVEADRRLSVFEFALQTLLRHRLQQPVRGAPRFRTMRPLDGDVAALLSVLAGFGHEDAETAGRAYAAGIAVWSRGADAPARGVHGPDAMATALRRLARASPPIKARVVDACAHCVLADEEVTVEEAELLRAVCVTLDCPLPPFLP
jgi:hypothetical protein